MVDDRYIVQITNNTLQVRNYNIRYGFDGSGTFTSTINPGETKPVVLGYGPFGKTLVTPGPYPFGSYTISWS